jgi:hypothetical protein
MYWITDTGGIYEHTIMCYAKLLSNNISVFASSKVAYFSLLLYSHESLQQCLFLLPIVNMERIIDKMMTWFKVSEDRLRLEKEISMPNGHIPILYVLT